MNDEISYDIPEAVTEQFNRLPVSWRQLEININLLPFTVPEGNTKGIFPFLILGVNPDDEIVVLMHTVIAKPDFDTMNMSLTETIMKKFIEIGQRPEEVLLKNLHLFPTLEHFNEHTETEANIAIDLPAHQKAFESLVDGLGNKAYGLESKA